MVKSTKILVTGLTRAIDSGLRVRLNAKRVNRGSHALGASFTEWLSGRLRTSLTGFPSRKAVQCAPRKPEAFLRLSETPPASRPWGPTGLPG